MPAFYIDPEIARAKTLATDFYLSPHWWEASKEKIFATSWQFVGDTDQIPFAGSVLPVTLLDEYLAEPLVLTRDQKNQVHCLSNVCTHRGNLVVEKACKLHDLRCKYHGRRFALDGTFAAMPEFKEVENFPSAADNLPRLPLFNFGKWLLTSLKPPHPAPHYFQELQARVGWMPFEEFKFRPDLSRDYLVDAHWALYCENYLEGFHIPFVHAGLNAVIDYGAYTTELFPFSNLQVGIAKQEDASFDLPPESPDFGKKIAGYYFWVFPNMMFNFYPWGLSINIVRPVTPACTKVSFITYVWREEKLMEGAGANLHQVEMEDEDVVQQVQRGIRSRFYTHGRYSVTRETGTHHFHRLLAERLNHGT
jgi:choline monooxygenase